MVSWYGSAPLRERSGGVKKLREGDPEEVARAATQPRRFRSVSETRPALTCYSSSLGLYERAAEAVAAACGLGADHDRADEHEGRELRKGNRGQPAKSPRAGLILLTMKQIQPKASSAFCWVQYGPV